MIMRESGVVEQSRLVKTLGSNYPWLVFPRYEDVSRQTFCSMSQPFKSYGKSTSKFRINRILGHSYGWLIISSKTIKKPTIQREFIFLWNPVSSESINLPPLDLRPDQEISNGSLLSPPCNPGSMVLVFESIVKSFIFCKLGDKKWPKKPANETDMETQIIDDETSRCNFLLCSPVNYKDELYAHVDGKLQVIDQILDIEIFRLDSVTMEWSKVKSSKDRAFFLSTNGSYAISCPTNKSGLEGGFVYFTRGTDRILYSFNIENKSISVSLPCKNLPPWSAPFWYMPDLSTTNPKTEVKQGEEEEETEVKQGEEEEEIQIEGRKRKQILKFSANKSEVEVRNLCDLPLDIIALIAENLYLVDYINFRLVCKTFRLLAPQIHWRETLKLDSHSLHPWLMFADQGNSRTLHTFIDPKLGDRYLMNIPKSIIDFDIRYSKEGWLLMMSKVDGDSMFFYNPFTKKLILVPPQIDFETYHSFGFTSLPTSPGCIVVGISCYSTSYFSFSGDEEWHEVWRDDYPYFIPGHNSPVYFDGAMYFLGQDGNLGLLSFDDDGAMIDWKVLEKPRKPCNSFDHNYLLECEGKLFSVFVDNLGESIGVFKLNETNMDWQKVRDLGKYMFFVSPSSSFSMVVKTPGMENKIYFPKLKGQEIVYYCLRTGKYRTFGSKQVATNFYNTTVYLAQSSSQWSSRKKEEASDAPASESLEARHDGLTFPKLTVSPLRRFQLLDSDSDCEDTGKGAHEIDPPSKGQQSTATDKKRKISVGIPQNEDLWKDFSPMNSFHIPTPAFDELCKEYFQSVKDKNAAQKLGRQTVEQLWDLDDPLPPAHLYFFHADPRMQKLVRSRLPFLLLPIKRGSQKGSSKNCSTSKRNKSKKSNAKETASEGWVDRKSSTAIPRNAKKRRVQASGQSAGHWYTSPEGRKVYASRSGQELSGQMADRHCRKESGAGFKRSKKKSNVEKKKG
ncbi:hypothetical protein REPUB_Repub05bG0031000 [Reevesia pubescens]